MDNIEVRVKGYVETAWSEWFEGLTVTHADGGDTVLSGTVADESALYGVLMKLSRLGLRLISVSVKGVNTPRHETL